MPLHSKIKVVRKHKHCGSNGLLWKGYLNRAAVTVDLRQRWWWSNTWVGDIYRLYTDKEMVYILAVKPRKTAQNSTEGFSVPKLVMAQNSHSFSGDTCTAHVAFHLHLGPSSLSFCSPHFLCIGCQLTLLLISHVGNPLFSGPQAAGTQALLSAPRMLACHSSIVFWERHFSQWITGITLLTSFWPICTLL